MEIERSAAGNVLVVKPVDRRLDARGATEFKSQMADVIGAGHHLIVLDLAAVDFIDSSGLGAIVSSLKLLGNRGDIVISGARSKVVNMFSLTRMDKVFRMFESAADGVAALTGE